MGMYINPLYGKSKERWVTDHSVKVVTKTEFVAHDPGKDGLVGVCFVVNKDFTAAAVAYDRAEAQAFARDDGRHKGFSMVRISDLLNKDSGIGQTDRRILEALTESKSKAKRVVIETEARRKEEQSQDDMMPSLLGSTIMNSMIDDITAPAPADPPAADPGFSGGEGGGFAGGGASGDF